MTFRAGPATRRPHRNTPFIVALNCFDGARRHEAGEIRQALDIDAHVPVVMCDARERESCRDALAALVDHAIAQLGIERPAANEEPALVASLVVEALGRTRAPSPSGESSCGP